MTSWQLVLSVEFEQEGDTWAAWCSELDVASQGSSKAEALEMLNDAVSLFLATCHEIGTLHRVLEDGGLTPLKLHSEPEEGAVSVPIDLVIQPCRRSCRRLARKRSGKSASLMVGRSGVIRGLTRP